MTLRDTADIRATTMSMTALFTYPLRGQGAALMSICALGLYVLLALLHWSAAYQGFSGIVLLFAPLPLLTLFAVLQLYAWMILRHLALGHVAPVFSIAATEISPYANLLAFKVTAVMGAMAGAVAACASLNAMLGVLIGLPVALLVPAMLAVIAIEERFRDGFNPRQLARVVAGLGAAYLAFVFVLASGVAALAFACVRGATPNILSVLAASYLFVLGHVLAGRLLYAHRGALGLTTTADPTAQQAAATAVAESIDTLMLQLHRMCASGRPRRADAALEAFLAEGEYALDEHVHQRLQLFQDRRLLLAHSERYIERLESAGKYLPAWLVLRNAIAIDAAFRPASAQTLLALIDHADARDAATVDTLLGDFEAAYPSSELLPDALLLHARWCVLHLGSVDRALVYLKRIETQFPEFAMRPEFRAFAERIRRHAERRA